MPHVLSGGLLAQPSPLSILRVYAVAVLRNVARSIQAKLLAMPRPKNPVMLKHARAADSFHPVPLKPRVLGRELVPTDTVRFCRIGSRRSDATQNVLAMRYGFQVRWIHASAVAAEVVEVKAFGDSADYSLVNKAMGVNIFPAVPVLAITVVKNSAGPVPAISRNVNTVTRAPALRLKMGNHATKYRHLWSAAI